MCTQVTVLVCVGGDDAWGGGGGRVLVNGSRPGGALSQSGNGAVFQKKTRLRFRFTSHGRGYIQYSERRTTSPWLTRSASRKQR